MTGGAFDFLKRMKAAVDDADYILSKVAEIAKKHREPLSQLAKDVLAFVDDAAGKLSSASSSSAGSGTPNYEFHVFDGEIVLVAGNFADEPTVRVMDERTLLVNDDVLSIPEPINARSISAKFKNGVLSVVMQRKKSGEAEIPRWGESTET